ncbi:MAG: cellulose synthase family protein [candidate division WOR-3 bacterium]
MLNLFDTLILILYFVILAILSLYGIHRYFLIFLYLKGRKKVIKPKSYFKELPKVTIQLPIYNEKFVCERLINSVCQIDYPLDKLEIQVLDDSTDETQEILKRLVKKYQEKGINIKYFHRNNREGYKAGALQRGLMKAEGDFIAVFDADFIVPRDFLLKTIHYFTDEKVGMVQTRWGHINKNYSLLTRLQAILLDGHFIIEHIARSHNNLFFNFNGTAGIWRKKTLLQTGGWDGSTLAEDLDISLRAQLLGWKFIYLPNYVVYAELPIEINSFKAQQYRWAKGGVQTAKKMLGIILNSKIPFKQKLESFFHLTANFSFPLMLILTIITFPAAIIRYGLNFKHILMVDFPLFFFSAFSFFLFYLITQKDLTPNWKKEIKYIIMAMSLGTALAISNSTAVFEALLNLNSEFIRTPKYGITEEKKFMKEGYILNFKNSIRYLEIIFTFYLLVGIIAVLFQQVFLTFPFLLFFPIGYFYLTFLPNWNKIKNFFINYLSTKLTAVSEVFRRD